jgi:hypothetical protein
MEVPAFAGAFSRGAPTVHSTTGRSGAGAPVRPANSSKLAGPPSYAPSGAAAMKVSSEEYWSRDSFVGCLDPEVQGALLHLGMRCPAC